MKETSSKHFGFLIAYLLPGFIVLFGLARFAPTVADWLRPTSQGTLGVGPTVYAILAAIAIGMIISCFRWLLIDHLHFWMGIRRPAWNDSQLEDRLSAFDYLVEAHYRYYQFYANTIVAIAFSYGLNRFMKTSPLLGLGTDLVVAILCIVLFVGSRDALSNYYAGTTRLVGHVAEKDSGNDMTNGRDHDSVGCVTSPKKATDTKPEQKLQPQASKPQPSPQSTGTPQEQQ